MARETSWFSYLSGVKKKGEKEREREETTSYNVARFKNRSNSRFISLLCATNFYIIRNLIQNG